MRQAGSIRLNLDPGSLAGGDPTLAAVAFEFKADAVSGGNAFDINDTTHIISGTGTSLAPAYQRYQDAVFTNASLQSLSRNCVGAPGDTSTDQRIENTFQISGTELQCGGNGAVAQAIIQNVANFQVRYLQQAAAGSGTPQIQYANAAAVGQPTAPGWSEVFGVEVCLVLYGNEPIDLPNGSTYTDCNGTTTVDMSNPLATDMNGSAIGPQRARRMHMVFRNIYQLRSQGQAG
jgi:type IV pilus assembly protein PilW